MDMPIEIPGTRDLKCNVLILDTSNSYIINVIDWVRILH